MSIVESKEANTAEGIANAAGERAKNYVDSGVSVCNAVSEKARMIGRKTDGYVRDNPWLAMGAAAGIGILVGLLLRGRRES